MKQIFSTIFLISFLFVALFGFSFMSHTEYGLYGICMGEKTNCISHQALNMVSKHIGAYIQFLSVSGFGISSLLIFLSLSILILPIFTNKFITLFVKKFFSFRNIIYQIIWPKIIFNKWFSFSHGKYFDYFLPAY